jgi:hypothetical protein
MLTAPIVPIGNALNAIGASGSRDRDAICHARIFDTLVQAVESDVNILLNVYAN